MNLREKSGYLGFPGRVVILQRFEGASSPSRDAHFYQTRMKNKLVLACWRICLRPFVQFDDPDRA